jgi:hypothetical protein
MMTREDRQEALSLAYVHAVAAMCGMTHYAPSKDYGIDLTLHEIGEAPHRYFESGIAIEIQLKSTTAAVETRNAISFDLPVRSYDILRAETDQPRLLVVLELPAADSEWLRVTRTRLELRKCAYWVSLRGQSAVRNRSSIRVAIPKRQLFTPSAVNEIIERIRRGEDIT